MRKLVKKNGRTSNALEAYMLKVVCGCGWYTCWCQSWDQSKHASTSKTENNSIYFKTHE